MATLEEKLKQLTIDLYHVQGVKFGDFTLKLGIKSPIYFDLRVIVSYPKLMNDLCDILHEYSKTLSFDILCGVPYTALPLATLLSSKANVPMVIKRKEVKSYGTKKLIEGNIKQGCTCLIIEDVVTTGSSVLETVNDLTLAGAICREVVVLLDRQQGGEQILESKGIKMHSLLSMSQLLVNLKEANCITEETVKRVNEYINGSQFKSDVLENGTTPKRLELTFEERKKYCNNSVSEQLLDIMAKKKTNLCLAADVTSSKELLKLADLVGPDICMFKTHIDILEDFSEDVIKQLKALAKLHNFLIFEDRKFADIGKTVELQFTRGIYKISDWANVVTIHSITGKGVIDALKQSQEKLNVGIFLLGETSAKGNLIDEGYVKKSLNLVADNLDAVTGVVCQNPLFLDNPGLLQVTPGVQLNNTQDDLGQQYNTPEHIVSERGADIAVVGRGITQAKDVKAAAELYKNELWNAYIKRIHK